MAGRRAGAGAILADGQASEELFDAGQTLIETVNLLLACGQSACSGSALGGRGPGTCPDLAPGLRHTHYWAEIRTLCLPSLGFWPAPVVAHCRWAVRQLEHGVSLSHRIFSGRRPSVPDITSERRSVKSPNAPFSHDIGRTTSLISPLTRGTRQGVSKTEYGTGELDKRVTHRSLRPRVRGLRAVDVVVHSQLLGTSGQGEDYLSGKLTEAKCLGL